MGAEEVIQPLEQSVTQVTDLTVATAMRQA
jgi:hypothetical protein